MRTCVTRETHPFYLSKFVCFAILKICLFFPSAVLAETTVQRTSAWTKSRIQGTPEPPRPYVTERIFPSLTFDRPCELVHIPDSNRLAVLEANSGKIYSFENRPHDPLVKADLFAEIDRCGPGFTFVYGLAFHPKFSENRSCFISYVLKNDDPAGSRVSRFKVRNTTPPTVDSDSEEILFTWRGGGHNGAHLQFGPDGYLYISTGDGGSSFPPDGLNTGQDVSDVLASILRIDVDRTEPGLRYAIPKDNPFVGRPNTREEIWAFGLRNPWKMCFDPTDGSLWTADVGWEKWEMVYAIKKGGNYGWSVMEGSQGVHQERAVGPTPILPPTVEHSHIESRSITGGYFYNAQRLPELKGAYVYGDYVTGKIWALRHQQGNVTWRDELVDTTLQISSFGIDALGEVVIVDYPTGTLHRLLPNPRRDSNSEFPRRLSETGLFADTKSHQLEQGIHPFTVNASMWADGTSAERFIALPGTTQLDVYESSNVQIGYIAGEWKFPDGGVLAKTVSIATESGSPQSRRRLETQILHFDVDTWKSYNYIWNEQQTDAILADDVSSQTVVSIVDPQAPGGSRQQTWRHASRTECLLCHTSRVGTIHGFRPPQLSNSKPAAGSQKDQLAELASQGLFAKLIDQRIEPWTDPYSHPQPLDARARSYLQVNCGHCHSRGGGGSAAFDVQFHIPLDKARLLSARPTQGTFGILGAEVVAPGAPYRSVLYYRMSKLGHGHMPQFGAQTIDRDGLKLIHDWIASLQPDPQTTSHSVRSIASTEQKRVEQLLAAVDNNVAAEQAKLLLSSPSGALRLVDAIEATTARPSIRQQIIDLAMQHSDTAVRDLFERFLPEEKRIKRLGNHIDSADILAQRGNADAGRKLMLAASGVQCRNCHRLGDQGQSLGPDLTNIGKKLDRPKLLESLVDPSKVIDEQFATYLLETADGRVVTGLLIKKDDHEVILRQADRTELRIQVADIDRLVPQRKSLMPELLLSELTVEQVRDLLEYLAQLK